MEHEFQGLWVPACLLRDTELTPFQKLLIAEIDGLSGPKNGPCHASASYLSKVMNSTDGNIRNELSDLTKRGYLIQLGSDGVTTWRCVAPKYSSNLGKYAAWLGDEKLPEGVTQRLQGCQLQGMASSVAGDRGVSVTADTENKGIISKKSTSRFSLEDAKALELPPSLQTPTFVEAWNNLWLPHRFQHHSGKPSQLTIELTIKRCAKMGPVESVRMIEKAVAGGWQGIPDPLPEQKYGKPPEPEVYKPGSSFRGRYS